MIHSDTAIPGVTSNARGRVLTSPQSRHAEKVFFCRDGRRHWITTSDWLSENGFHWPADVQQVPPDVLDSYLPGRNAARSWGRGAWLNPPRRGTLEMREIAVSRFTGRGIEVGAGAAPMPIPLSCDVQYVDLYDLNGLHEQRYKGQASADIMIPDIVASFEDLSPIPDDSLDFIVACHVIEHTHDPIGTITGAWRKLATGGWLTLVVPDITRTFDRHRALTSLTHFIADYRDPSARVARDEWHFREFYAVALPADPDEYEQVWRLNWANAYPIHFHTWTHKSFREMLNWTIAEGLLPGLAEIWSQPPLADPSECNEFWISIQKG